MDGAMGDRIVQGTKYYVTGVARFIIDIKNGLR